MLLLPAAALCCLCSGLVAVAAGQTQNQLSLTRKNGERASFSCEGADQCGHVWWFQKKETFTLILGSDRGGSVYSDSNHPQKDDFTVERKGTSCELKIKSVKLSHSATYYCSCGYHYASGTKLFVTAEPVAPPVVSVYPAASRDGKSSLLCVASNMTPPLVQFSWRRQRGGGPLEELSSAQTEQLDLRGHAAVLVVDQDASYTYNYRCQVRHEGGTVEAPAEQEVSAATEEASPEEASPEEASPEELSPEEASPEEASPEEASPAAAWSRLLCLLYTLLMLKSLVYCCGLSLINVLRDRASPTQLD